MSALKAQPNRKEIITTVVEHPAVLTLCEHLEKEGYKVHYLKVDTKGRLDLEEYRKLLSDQVAVRFHKTQLRIDVGFDVVDKFRTDQTQSILVLFPDLALILPEIFIRSQN